MWALFFWKEWQERKELTMNMNTINVNDFRATKFDGYFVNAKGDVLSLKSKTPRLLSQVTVNGYKMVIMYNDGKAHLEYVHRLVAEAFLPNPENKPMVNHKDSNPSNNCVENLEWCTQSENILHAVKLGRHVNNISKYNNRKRVVKS